MLELATGLGADMSAQVWPRPRLATGAGEALEEELPGRLASDPARGRGRRRCRLWAGRRGFARVAGLPVGNN